MCRAIETQGTEVAAVTYIFGAESKPFLDVVTKSGATYKFLQVGTWLVSVCIQLSLMECIYRHPE